MSEKEKKEQQPEDSLLLSGKSDEEIEAIMDQKFVHAIASGKVNPESVEDMLGHLFDMILDEVEREVDNIHTPELALQSYKALIAADLNQDGVLHGKAEVLAAHKSLNEIDHALAEFMKDTEEKMCDAAHGGDLTAQSALEKHTDAIKLGLYEKRLAEVIDKGKGVEAIAQRYKIMVFGDLMDAISDIFSEGSEEFKELATLIDDKTKDALADKIVHRVRAFSEKMVTKTVDILAKNPEAREAALAMPTPGVIPNVSWQDYCQASQTCADNECGR